jgi:preprotein translocase subunit SecA
MQAHLRHATIALALIAGTGIALAQTSPGAPPSPGSPAIRQDQKLQLTQQQKSAIFAAVRQDAKQIKLPPNFRVAVGAQVPPSIELHTLPDSAIASHAMLRDYKYTVVQNQVILVDPTTMRVVEVIRK